MMAMRPGLCALLAPVLFLASACSNLCGNDTVETTAAPDRSSSVVVFHRGCGATTGISTQISILGYGSRMPDGSGNMFIAESRGREAPPVRVVWKDAHSLLVEYPVGATVYLKETIVRGVSVTYKPIQYPPQEPQHSP